MAHKIIDIEEPNANLAREVNFNIYPSGLTSGNVNYVNPMEVYT